MFKTCWDILVLLATIYVAIVVPYNAAFHDPVRCHTDITSDIHLVGNSILASRYTGGEEPLAAGSASDSEQYRVPRDTSSKSRGEFLRSLGLNVPIEPSDNQQRVKTSTNETGSDSQIGKVVQGSHDKSEEVKSKKEMTNSDSVEMDSDSEKERVKRQAPSSSLRRHHRVHRRSSSPSNDHESMSTTEKTAQSEEESSEGSSSDNGGRQSPYTLKLTSGAPSNRTASPIHEVVIEEMDEEQKKASIVIDVIVEAIFIIGKTRPDV